MSQHKKVRKAVFPVAGLGTRFLPATKSVPKEMLTVVDKPVIQYVVEEALEAGIEHLVFVTGRNKHVIEDYFDIQFELASHGGQIVDDSLCFERIGTWPLLVAMPDSHPLVDAQPLQVSMLGAEPLIVYAAHGADENMLGGLRRALGREPKVHRTSSTLSVLALVAAGMGVALVPEPLLQVHIPGVAYRRLGGMEPQADLLLVSRNEETGGAVRAFLGIARQGLAGE